MKGLRDAFLFGLVTSPLIVLVTLSLVPFYIAEVRRARRRGKRLDVFPT